MKRPANTRKAIATPYGLPWALISIEGLIALVALLRIPSEASSAVLFGLSPVRLLAAVSAALAVLASGTLAIGAWSKSPWRKKMLVAFRRFFRLPRRRFILFVILYSIVLSTTALMVLSISPAASELVFLRSLLDRIGLLLLWIVLSSVQIGIYLFSKVLVQGKRQRFFTPWRRAVLISIATLVYFTALKIYTTATWDIRMRGLEEYIFLPALVAVVWGGLHYFCRERPWYALASQVLLLAMIGVLTYTLYRHTAQWMDWQRTPSKAYWHSLADAFLHGRLYLEQPESQHDLTFFNNHWYVPNPPLPALVMLPFVALVGAANINTVLFSIMCGAINVVLVFVALQQAGRAGLISTDQRANLLLTAVFALGTTHWWLSIMGRMWFLSQVLTLTFTTLAAIFAIRKSSPWLVGLGIGIAVLSRPNAFTLWPLMAGITLYFEQREQGRVRWGRMIGWAVQSAVPVMLGAGALLSYNYIRFGSFLDFGYVTINSSDWLMSAVQTYGMFNAHFLPINLHAMFLKLPIIEMRGSCFYYSPTREGISILAMTPAVLYIFRRFRLNWWAAGAWASVVASIGLLLIYHNTGAWQLGYRYLMDFMLPVLLLMAVGIGQRASWQFKALVLLSLLGNAAGIIWWFNKWWCG